MKIGCPCINRGIGCTAGGTFKLAFCSDSLLEKKVACSPACLKESFCFRLAYAWFWSRSCVRWSEDKTLHG
jgi:hypothetical protein